MPLVGRDRKHYLISAYEHQIGLGDIDVIATKQKLPRGGRGRPRVRAVPGELSAVTVRIPGQLKNQLDDAAAQSGRTQSEEAAQRIQASFVAQDDAPNVLRLAYGDRLTSILLAVAYVMQRAGVFAALASARILKTGDLLHAADNWIANPVGWGQAIEAARVLLDGLSPLGDATPPGLRELEGEFPAADLPLHLGETMATRLLAAVAHPERAGVGLEADLARSISSKIHPNVGRLKLYIEKIRQEAAGNDTFARIASGEVQSGLENGANPRLEGSTDEQSQEKD